MRILEGALSNPSSNVSPQIKTQLESAITRDIEELLPHLISRGEEIQEEAAKALTKRGSVESEEMVRVLEDQRERVLKQLDDTRASRSNFAFDDDQERKQFVANRKYWEGWLLNVDGDLEREPRRIREFYQVKSSRIEPVGLVYLWPFTG